MHLLRSPFFIWAHFEFSLQAVHIKETDNALADAISHNNHVLLNSQVFRSTYQWTPLPEELTILLTVEQANWTSDRWTQLFKNCLQPAWLWLRSRYVYRTGTNRYTSFCVFYNVSQPLPVSKDVLTRFGVYLYTKGLKAGIINELSCKDSPCTNSIGPRQPPN